jgi:hypothetical protein
MNIIFQASEIFDSWQDPHNQTWEYVSVANELLSRACTYSDSDLQLIMSHGYFPTKNTTIAPFSTQNNSTTTPGVPLSREVRYISILKNHYSKT